MERVEMNKQASKSSESSNNDASSVSLSERLPCLAFQRLMSSCNAWFKIRSLGRSGSLVKGCLSLCRNHPKMADLSNEWPAIVIKGLFMISKVSGQMNRSGTPSLLISSHCNFIVLKRSGMNWLDWYRVLLSKLKFLWTNKGERRFPVHPSFSSLIVWKHYSWCWWSVLWRSAAKRNLSRAITPETVRFSVLRSWCFMHKLFSDGQEKGTIVLSNSYLNATKLTFLPKSPWLY